MKKCPKCKKMLKPTEFYMQWPRNPSACRKCYREGINAQKLHKAIAEGDVQRIENTKARQERLAQRGPRPAGKHWCGGCTKWLPDSAFAKKQLSLQGQCRDCASTYSLLRNMRLKKRMIDYFGGKCDRCGWSGHWAGYDLHHRNPNDKEISWGGRDGLRKHSWEKILPELEKCKLLCSTCHNIIHASLDNDGQPNPEYVPARSRKQYAPARVLRGLRKNKYVAYGK